MYVPAACLYAGNAFCTAVFVLLSCELPLTDPPPEASSSVAREYMRPEARA